MNLMEVMFSGSTSNFRSASFNVYLGLSVEAHRTAVQKHINRVNADFVTLTEINSADWSYLQSTYTDYPYQRSVAGNVQVYAMSKYEILASEEIVMSGRNPLYCEIEISGKKIGVVSYHNASWCIGNCNTSGSQLPTEPMAHDRMVQLYMVLNFLEDKKTNDSTLKGFIIQGDWNDDTTHTQVQTYNSAPSGGMSLPGYLSYPLDNAQFPLKPLESYNGQFNLDLSTDLNGDIYTIWDNDPNDALTFPMRLDYIAYSDEIELVGGEILNSEVDANTGLPKIGAPLNFADSRDASDHKLVFADFKV